MNTTNLIPLQKPQETTHNTYRLSIRFNKSVTSISINTKLLCFWLFIKVLTDTTNVVPKLKNQPSLKNFISDFVNKQLTNWKGSSNKGLSDFISSCIFLDICNDLDFDRNDFLEFFNDVQEKLF